MISQKTQLKVEIEKKDYSFQCDPNASLNEVNQALDMFRSYVYGRIKEEEDKNSKKEVKEEDGDQQ